MNYNIKHCEMNSSVYRPELASNTSDTKFVDNIDDLASKSSVGWKWLNSTIKWEISELTKNIGQDLPQSKLSSNFQDVSGLLTPELHAAKLLILIKNSYYEDGEASPVDHQIKHIFDQFGEEYILMVLNILWRECFVSKNQTEHAYFLNCIRNISYYMKPDFLVPFACSAIAHKSLLIKEAGIATFESWDKVEHKSYLENVDTSGHYWLEEYKYEVMENLGI